MHGCEPRTESNQEINIRRAWPMRGTGPYVTAGSSQFITMAQWYRHYFSHEDSVSKGR